MTRLFRSYGPALLLILGAYCALAAAPKRILILDSFERDVAPFSAAVSSFRAALTGEIHEPVDIFIYEESLETGWFADPSLEKPFKVFLQQRFADRAIDLVVPVGEPACKFVTRSVGRSFPETPIMSIVGDPRVVPPGSLPTNATFIAQQVNLPGMIEDILQLKPDTTNIMVVIGTSPLEKFWASECRREWQPFTNLVGFSWLDTLSLKQITERVRILPPHSFVLFLMLIMDAEGVLYDQEEPLRIIHPAANAPIYGYFQSQLGLGIIGGRLHENSRLGSEAARTAIRILRGEKAGVIPPKILGPSRPAYDWRELKRWGVALERLPSGSIVEFREPTFWERYRWRIVGVALFCCVETALIIGLVVNALARKRSESQAQRHRQELAHMNRASALGELAGSLAHELNQPLMAVLSNAQAASRFLAHDPNEVREILNDIAEESRRAGEVIQRMRSMLKKDKVQNELIDLNDSIATVLSIMRSDLNSRKVVVRTGLAPGPSLVIGDKIQLTQVLLNLIANAGDAMRGKAASERRLAITTERKGGNIIEVSVSDHGTGISPERLEQVFEPFFSTKAQGIGMGLAICRSIIEAHGGRLWAENNVHGGATFHFTLPMAGEEQPSVPHRSTTNSHRND